ncbi:MAG: DUF3054 domain-containing protein [Candidatus Phosphoribacter sp.]
MSTQPSRAAGAASAALRMPWAPVVDVVLVVVFAALGRASHDADNPVVGALATAWPFLVGLAGGWALVRWRSGRWPLDVGAGVTTWVCTLVLGMVLRTLTGQGTHWSFILVAASVLAVFLVGWRWLAHRLARGRPVAA